MIYGAGVLGSFYAARLKEAGQNVSILARGQRGIELRNHGIVIEDPNVDGCMTTYVKVTASK